MKYQRLFLFQLFLFVFVSAGNAQSFFNSLGVTASGALQQHDNRRYRSEYSPDELRNQDGSDYQYAIGIHSNLWRKNAWAIDVGVGYSKYVNTFFQPFHHGYFVNGPVDYRLRHTRQYETDLLLFPVDIRYYIKPTSKNNFYFSLQVLPAITVYKKVPYEGTEYNKSLFEFYNLEINPGVGFNFNNQLNFTLASRVFQFKQIDRVLFNLEDKTHETFNPFKLWLSVQYDIFIKK